MRLQIFSDFHFDVAPALPPHLAPGVDVVVVAGDVCEGMTPGFEWLRRNLGAELPIVFVAGNHEYFRRSIVTERIAAADAARLHSIDLLDNQIVQLGSVRFIGTTLWADFDLFGEYKRAEAMRVAEAYMVDHRQILEADGAPFRAMDARRLHLSCRRFLDEQLALPHDGATVVVTHHGPHPKSLAKKFSKDPLSAAFISDLSQIIETYQPALWVHGHTHVSFDYRVGATRIVCNPHGYGDENPAFNPALIVDL